jgi:hypothetical protein
VTADLTIGRCDFRNGVTRQATQRGDSLTLAGRFEPDDPAAAASQALAFRQQIAGLADDQDQRFVPLSSVKRPELDGFYFVDATTVAELATVSEVAGIVDWSASLRRVPGNFAAPSIDVRNVSAVAPNGQSVTTPERFLHGYPTGALAEVYLDDLPAKSQTFTETIHDPSTSYGFIVSNNATAGVVDVTIQQIADVATFYELGAFIEVRASGGAWYPLIGRQVPTWVDEWRLSNGVVSLRYAGGVELFAGIASGQAWKERAIQHGEFSGGTFVQLSAAQLPTFSVLRNNVDRVAVRMVSGTEQLTWTITRGIVAAHLLYSRRPKLPGGELGVGLASSNTEAGTAVTGGVQTTSADGDGFKFNAVSLAAEQISTTETAVGTSAVSTDARFALGFERPTPSITAPAAMLDALVANPAKSSDVVQR